MIATAIFGLSAGAKEIYPHGHDNVPRCDWRHTFTFFHANHLRRSRFTTSDIGVPKKAVRPVPSFDTPTMAFLMISIFSGFKGIRALSFGTVNALSLCRDLQ